MYEIVASPVALIATPISAPAVMFVIPVFTSVNVSGFDTVAVKPVPALKAGVPTVNVTVSALVTVSDVTPSEISNVNAPPPGSAVQAPVLPSK